MAETPKTETATTETKAGVATTEKAAVTATPTETKPATTETKPAAEVKTAEAAKTAEEPKSLLEEAGDKKEEVKASEEKPAVPEKYEFKIPEGKTLDQSALDAAIPVFKELGLSQDQAQKLVDLQLGMVKQAEDSQVAKFNAYVEEQKQETIKFFGPKLKEAMGNVAKARDQFMTKELREELEMSGFANNKHMMVFLERIGRLTGEGKFVEGQSAAFKEGEGGKASLAKIYPSMAR